MNNLVQNLPPVRRLAGLFLLGCCLAFLFFLGLLPSVPGGGLDAAAQVEFTPSPALEEAGLQPGMALAARQEQTPFGSPLPPRLATAAVVLPTATATPGLQLPLPFTPTLTATVMVTPTATLTATVTLTPTATPTQATPFAFLPVVPNQPTPTPTPTSTASPTPELPPADVLVCFDRTTSIPDNDAGGAVLDLFAADARLIHDLDVSLDIEHTWVGDLAVELTHLESGRSVELLDRPSYPEVDTGCRNDDIAAILDDELTLPADGRCNTSPAAIAGIYTPAESLSSFDGLPLAGTWRLTVRDMSRYDTGSLKNWCLRAQVAASPPAPTPPPPVYNLPPSARIHNITSQHQALPLDCESRVAVDWAAFFGYSIGELDFFYNLPVSDNPDAGFVGDVNGDWGQVPPNPYGVHAEPVAALLRAYGVPAYAHRPLTWDALRAEIAAGRPVYVWTIGSGKSHGIPQYYLARDGHLTVVARYEHTIMVIGYSPDGVTILDGGVVAERTLEEFLGSWSALGNMAITANP